MPDSRPELNLPSDKTFISPICLPVMFCLLTLLFITGGANTSLAATDRPQEAGSKTPHIVLVMTDDQGYGQTGYYGHPRLKTPHLDAMAARGLRLDRYYAGGPVCSPTRASVLTGRTHQRTGVESHGYALHRQETTLAQSLSEVGYVTGHFGKWHLNGIRGPGVPVLANDPYGPGKFGFQKWVSVTNFFDRDPLLSRMGEIEAFEGDSSEVAVDEAIAFIQNCVSAGKPSFTVIWYGTPHSPFRAAEEDMAPFADLAPNARHQLGELVAMDRSIGTLQAALEELDIADSTLVWFTSDNGGLPNMKPETTGGLRGYKGSLYEGGIRVPAIIQWPEVIRPRATSHPAVAMDIAPTLADIVGLDVSAWNQPLDGVSLRPLFDGETGPREAPIPFHFQGHSAMIDNDFKLIHWGQQNRRPPRFELYDLQQDPEESINLIEDLPQRAAQMKSWLAAHRASVDRSQQGLDYQSGEVADDHRQPTRWSDMEDYQRYFESWSQRPEYQGELRKRSQRKNQ